MAKRSDDTAADLPLVPLGGALTLAALAASPIFAPPPPPPPSFFEVLVSNPLALGTAVVFGMIGVTVFGLVFTPAFYVVCRKLASRLPTRAPRAPQASGHPTYDGEAQEVRP